MEDGVALPEIQQLPGHTSLKTTSVYCHVSRALLGSVRSPVDMSATAAWSSRCRTPSIRCCKGGHLAFMREHDQTRRCQGVRSPPCTSCPVQRGLRTRRVRAAPPTGAERGGSAVPNSR